MATPQVNEQAPSSTDLLTPQEQSVCKQVAQGEAPHSLRASALLALQSGSTQAQAAQQSGLSQGQVAYWLAQFRKKRLAIFPESILNNETKPEPKVKKADSGKKKAKKSEEKSVEAEKEEKVKKDKKGKKSKKSKKKSGKDKKDKKDKKGKKKKKGKNDKKKK